MKRFALAALALGVLASGPALAASGRDIVMQGSKARALACSACHGVQGAGQPGAGIPRLAGLNATYLAHQLASFASGARMNVTMTPIAKALTKAERRAVAAYYARQKIKPAATATLANIASLAAGAALAMRGDWAKSVPGCSQCHGAKGEGVGATFPRLAGQAADYIAAQLKAWRAGTRHNDPMGLMAGIAKKLDADEIASVAAYYAAFPKVPAPAPQTTAATQAGFTPPPESAIPKSDFGQMVRLGENVFRNTQKYAARYVGNTLNCQNCHLDAGRRAGSAPLWAAFVSYPAYRSKNKHVNTYAERLQGCFRYSMNGRPPPPGSKVLVALQAYSYFLARGAPVGTDMKGRGYPAVKRPAKPFDYARGETVYRKSCALCHGANGQGQKSATGAPVFPALWGAHSFNWGAGMGNIKNAAAFIKANMPFSRAGTLTDQEAWDVAAFVDSRERPQDPRFTGSVAETRKKFHNSATWMYGLTVNGAVLGAYSPPSGRR
jgi:thiosulfate dehydrogenase